MDLGGIILPLTGWESSLTMMAPSQIFVIATQEKQRGHDHYRSTSVRSGDFLGCKFAEREAEQCISVRI